MVKLAARSKYRLAQFDLLKETWPRTTCSSHKSAPWLISSGVTDGNLGAISSRATLTALAGSSAGSAWQDHVLDIAAPPEVMRYVVFKGSMAVDGISLTVAGVGASFRMWIIPNNSSRWRRHCAKRKTSDAARTWKPI